MSHETELKHPPGKQRSDHDLSAALSEMMLDLNTALCDCHGRPDRAGVYELLINAWDHLYDARATISKALGQTTMSHEMGDK